MTSKTFATLFGLLTIIAILGASSEITTMTASAQATNTDNPCTESQPCNVDVCGDHVCAPGELAQMNSQSVQTQRDINNNGTSTTPRSTTTSSGVIVGGIVSYMHKASDGTAVVVRTGHPMSGQPLSIGIGFKDANNNFVLHQNYAITVTQDGKTVLSNAAGHTHTGTDTQTTYPLSSNNPVDITVTLNGVGLPTADPSTWTGAKGEAIIFSQAMDIKALTMPMSDMSNMKNTTAPAGNVTVPEFGPVASIVLAIAVLSIIVFAAKTRVIPRL